MPYCSFTQQRMNNSVSPSTFIWWTNEIGSSTEEYFELFISGAHL